MGLINIFHRKKSRKHPIQRDAQGLSLRERCFHDFDEGKGPAEVAKIYKMKEETALRYHRDWQRRGPHFEERYTFLKELLYLTPPGKRDKIIELLAIVWGTSRENMETILSTPHGLLRLVSGKVPLQSDEDTWHKIQMSLELGYIMADYLVKRQGRCSDLFFSLKDFLEEGLRSPAYTNTAEFEQTLKMVYGVMEQDLQKEKQGLMKQHGLTEKEVDLLLKLNAFQTKKNPEATYRLHLISLVAKGYSPEQAHQEICQHFIKKGDTVGAEMIQEFHDRFLRPESNS